MYELDTYEETSGFEYRGEAGLYPESVQAPWEDFAKMGALSERRIAIQDYWHRVRVGKYQADHKLAGNLGDGNSWTESRRPAE